MLREAPAASLGARRHCPEEGDVAVADPLSGPASLVDALARRPMAVLTDVDGTISPLAPTPWEAYVTPRSRQLLGQLSTQALVGVISGRDLGDLQRMVSLPDIVYVGLHGLAWRSAGTNELAPEAEPYRRHTQEAAAELSHLKRIDGLVLEVKSVGLAFHYRNVRRAEAARFEILRALASSPAAARFEVHEGIRVVELRPPVGITKGVALARLVDRFSLRGLLYLGDDRTDMDAFEEVRRLRERAGLSAYAIAVVHPEAPTAVARAADFTVEGVKGTERLLAGILELLQRDGSARGHHPQSRG